MKNQYTNNLLSKITAQLVFGLVFFASIVSFDRVKAQAPYCGPTYSFACSSQDLINNFSTTGGASNITNNKNNEYCKLTN